MVNLPIILADAATYAPTICLALATCVLFLAAIRDRGRRAPALADAAAATLVSSVAAAPTSAERLEPFISGRALALHHGAHHASYIDSSTTGRNRAGRGQRSAPAVP